VARGFLALGQGHAWTARAPERELLLELDRPIGHDYWALMTLAGRYAYAGREWVARKVVSILGARELELVHNHHNFAWKETHGGEELVVVRKGATPAFPGQQGFVGGSMGDDAVIVRGGGTDESPHVYRWLPDVLAAQEGTVEVLHTLRPLVVVMAGEEEFDPYKD